MQESLAARELIERAFRLAKKSGKPEWWVMAVPVLKNRILQLTNGSFKETDFAAPNFREFLQKNSEAIRIDDSFSPGAVIFKAGENEPLEPVSRASHSREQIRPDLWRAVLDYSSGNRYQWDQQDNHAYVAQPDSKGPFLPTTSAEQVKAWKSEFLSTKAAKLPISEKLLSWRDEGLPTIALPAALRPAWNKYLRQKVQSTLKDWFEHQGVPSPAIVDSHTAPDHEVSSHGELRRFVIECVKFMSNEELERLPIPASIAMRAKLDH